MVLSGILLNPASSTCWNPKAKSPDGEVQEELSFATVRDEPKDMFLGGKFQLAYLSVLQS
jgi:hypothetical protein